MHLTIFVVRGGEGKVQYERFDGKIYKRDDAVNPPVILSAEEAATSLQ